jgi:hypothetical protein
MEYDVRSRGAWGTNKDWEEGKGERMSSWYDDWISSLFLLPYQDSQLPCVPPIPVCGATPVDVRLPSEVVRLSCLASS